MPKYHIHIDPKLPGSDEIARHKDFKKLYGDYQSATRFRFWRELRTNPRYFATLVMIVAVGALVWRSVRADEAASKPFVAAPFNTDIPFESRMIPADQGVNVTVGGLQLDVPQQAWADTNGTAITSGDVRLAYRVLKDPADFFLAGLPMQMAGAEQQYLEASPVVELRAFRGTEPVQLREGVAVAMQFDAQAKDSSLSTFWLDEAAKGWIAYQEPDRELLLDEELIMASLPNRPRLRSISSDEVPFEELRPKGAAAPPAQERPDPQAAYQTRLRAWEAKRDAAMEAARDSAKLRISFKASRLGYFALGQPLTQATTEQRIKLLTHEGERLGPPLDDAASTVWLYEPAYSTLRPCRYNGEGRHILDRLDTGEAMLWMRLPDGGLGVAEIDAQTEEIAVAVRAVGRTGLLLKAKGAGLGLKPPS